MRLSTMWRVDRTIGPDGRSPLTEQILERWPHDPGSARFFRSSANVVYTFHHNGVRRFLRLAADDERQRDAVEAEVALIAWLVAEGLPVARPLPSRNRSLVETVPTDARTFHAVAFVALDGAEREAGDLDASALRAWGAALARLHAATSRYPDAAPARPTWRDHLTIARAHLPEDKPALPREWDAVTSALAALPVSPRTFGLIHGDFELDNLRWQDHAVAMLDFDDCAVHWYAADIALAVRDLFPNGGIDATDSRLAAFLHGYAEHHPLDPDLSSNLPLFTRMSRLVEYARLRRALDLPAGPEYPEWLTRLVDKLQRRLSAYESSLDPRL